MPTPAPALASTSNSFQAGHAAARGLFALRLGISYNCGGLVAQKGRAGVVVLQQERVDVSTASFMPEHGSIVRTCRIPGAVLRSTKLLCSDGKTDKLCCCIAVSCTRNGDRAAQ